MPLEIIEANGLIYVLTDKNLYCVDYYAQPADSGGSSSIEVQS